MPLENLIVSPGPSSESVVAEDGTVLRVPAGWELLPPGDAGLTRRVKAAGPTWTVQVIVKRKKMSRGIWAPSENIAQAKAQLEAERSTEAYAKRRAADAKRREAKQADYVESFSQAVMEYLAFAPRYKDLANQLSKAVADHATPVGSGTVARTQRISVERRAEAAVIAWMRHQTTSYDDMKIARIKGKRREVRQELASFSRELLQRYRRGDDVIASQCPLQLALHKSSPPTTK